LKVLMENENGDTSKDAAVKVTAKKPATSTQTTETNVASSV